MEVKKIVEGMTAQQVAQVIDENFNALNGEKATVGAVADVQKNVNRSDDNTGILSYPVFDDTEPVAVGDVRRYEGLLYRAKEAGAHDWDPEKWERVTLKQLEDEKLSELGSEVGMGYNYVQGSVYNQNGILTFVAANTRIYTVVNGSVHIDCNDGYQVYNIYKGVLGGSSVNVGLNDSNDIKAEPNEKLYIVFSRTDTTQTITANVDIPAVIKTCLKFAVYEQGKEIKEVESEVKQLDSAIIKFEKELSYATKMKDNGLIGIIEQAYNSTSNIINPFKFIYKPYHLAISSTFVQRDNHVSFVVAKDVPIGKTISFALIYGDLTSNALKELGLSEVRCGISENYPEEGVAVKKMIVAGIPGIRQFLVNEDLANNYISINFVTERQGDEAIEAAINALQYLVVCIQDKYFGITTYIPPYDFKDVDIEALGAATKQDVEMLQKEIENIEGIDGTLEILNSVKVVPNTIIPLGQNILSNNYTYDNSYWSVEDGIIKYKGNGKDSTFVFATPTTNNGRYYARITCYTSDYKYEDLFITQLGETDIVDVYNGSHNTNGGYISDGGYFKIIATNSKPFEIRSIELLPIVDKDVAIELVELKTDNVHAGNSEATNINGKWNVAVGPSDSTMPNNINGSRSVAIGLNALRNWKGGLQNIVIGTFAASLLEYGDRNIVIGSDALWQVKRAFDNIVIGKGALGNTGQYAEVNRNIAIGYHAMISNSEKTQDSVAVGYYAGRNAGARNTFVGNNSGIPISGENNVGIGYSSMNTGYTDGNNNTCIGVNSGIDGKGTASAPKTINNSIAIGNGVKANKSNQVRIGNSDIEEVIIGNKKIIFNSDGTCTWEAVS